MDDLIVIETSDAVLVANRSRGQDVKHIVKALNDQALEEQTLHRLANPGSTPLEIIEVQSGSYLREDDIVRFEDYYEKKS